mmetsp:Transcript_23658/g.62525  ORF Transcript_23658/g.62525 Transcript_23658/m.62525 type:complete len:355 (-) Transcript_23658:115-1179(-)
MVLCAVPPLHPKLHLSPIEPPPRLTPPGPATQSALAHETCPKPPHAPSHRASPLHAPPASLPCALRVRVHPPPTPGSAGEAVSAALHGGRLSWQAVFHLSWAGFPGCGVSWQTAFHLSWQGVQGCAGGRQSWKCLQLANVFICSMPWTNSCLVMSPEPFLSKSSIATWTSSSWSEGFIATMADFISAVDTLPSPLLSSIEKMAEAISTLESCSLGSCAIACANSLKSIWPSPEGSISVYMLFSSASSSSTPSVAISPPSSSRSMKPEPSRSKSSKASLSSASCSGSSSLGLAAPRGLLSSVEWSFCARRACDESVLSILSILRDFSVFISCSVSRTDAAFFNCSTEVASTAAGR